MLESRSGRPVARAQVSIESAIGAANYTSKTAVTDSNGHFSFSPLPASVYRIAARKAGYASAKYGQVQWNAAGTPIVLEAQGHFVAVVRLHKLGAVSGTVFDENQIGLPGQTVNVYRAGPPLKLEGSAQTDDRGVYRVAGLEPGACYAATSARKLEDGRSLLPTYYGGTAFARDAKTIEVRLDEEATGIDIDPAPGRLFRLGGKLISPTSVTLALYSDMGKRLVSPDGAGRFLLEEMPPGNYQFLAESIAGPPLAAYRSLQLNGDAENIVLEMASAPALKIRWEVDGKPLEQKSISAFMRRKDPPDEKNPRRVMGDEVPTLTPGTWEMAVAPPTDYYVRAIMARSGDASHEFTLAAGQVLDLTVMLSSHPAILRGKVTASDGQPAMAPPVYLSPMEPDLRSRTNGGLKVQADLKGEYRFVGLPPGPYRVFSTFAASGPDGAPSLGKPVTLEEGQETTLDVELQ